MHLLLIRGQQVTQAQNGFTIGPEQKKKKAGSISSVRGSFQSAIKYKAKNFSGPGWMWSIAGPDGMGAAGFRACNLV